jgi:pyruvate/2-oxoglutarate dehydrogenase complex dihydrolipoamide acyltransferase (E2) component
MAEGRRKNTINLIFEADITVMRSLLSRFRADHGQDISITAYVAKSLASAIDDDRRMHAYRLGKTKMVVFDEVDIAFTVEREIEGNRLPVIHIVRAANRKDIGQIHAALQAAKTVPLGGKGMMSAAEKRFFKLPQWLRRIVWYFIRRDPYLFKRLLGTVGVTSMGMFTSEAAVLVPITPMTLTLSIGSISKKLELDNGISTEKEIIHLNLGADHDVIDGAPLMRFVELFKQKLSNGNALDS